MPNTTNGTAYVEFTNLDPLQKYYVKFTVHDNGNLYSFDGSITS